MTFAEKLIYLRRQDRCSQESLAEALNVSRQTISKWELGISQPSMEMIVFLSDYFHVSTDFLLREDTALEDSDALAKIVIRFLNSSQSMEMISKELVAIARDGVIDEEEKKMLSSISKEIDEIQRVIDELKALIAGALSD
ncbi:MAG: helix-turn-helix domain-containing protein [Lachnospiraceae bacterium]|nr:helix-turn-helix domain-containing protein [Lachnospiraceae bacterium]